LWIAVFIGILTGIGQFTRYNERNWSGWARKFTAHIGVAAGGALLLTMLNALWLDMRAWQLFALLFAAMFALVANLDYLITIARGNLKMAGSAVSHFGFGVLVLGILSTGLNKIWLSSNPFAMEGLIEGADNEAMQKNVLLMKDAPMPIRNELEVTYERDTVVRQTRTFQVRFKKRDASGNYTGESYVLTPNVMYNRQFTEIVASNPSTRHYWDRDIFTHVTSLPKAELDPEYAKIQEDSLKWITYEARIGDTIFTTKHYLVVEALTKKPEHPDYKPQPGDLAFGLKLRAYSLESPQAYPAAPAMYIRPGSGGFSHPANIGPLQMRIRLSEAAMEKIFKTENDLKYQEFPLKEGGSFTLNGYRVRFASVERAPRHPNYTPEQGDIAVAARLEITAPDGSKDTAAPVYLIRDNRPYSLKDEASAFGLHFQFSGIDPEKGLLTISAAQATEAQRSIPVEIAEDAPRSDYIVLEAILFPGINLVWIGSLAMLLGLAISLWKRLAMKFG
jgi:cytochrome c-type biogenesis protein CcmF